MSHYLYGTPKTHKLTPDEKTELLKYFPPKQIDPATGQEIPWSEEALPGLFANAMYARDSAKREKREAKDREKEQRAMIEYERQQREARERELRVRREANKRLPEEQFQMLRTGELPKYNDFRTKIAHVFFDKWGSISKVVDMKPGLALQNDLINRLQEENIRLQNELEQLRQHIND